MLSVFPCEALFFSRKVRKEAKALKNVQFCFLCFLRQRCVTPYSIFCASSWLAYSSSGSGNTFKIDSCNERTEEAE